MRVLPRQVGRVTTDSKGGRVTSDPLAKSCPVCDGHPATPKVIVVKVGASTQSIDRVGLSKMLNMTWMTTAPEKHLKDGPKTVENPQISTTGCLTVPPLPKTKKHVHGPHVLCARVLDTQQQKYQYNDKDKHSSQYQFGSFHSSTHVFLSNFAIPNQNLLSVIHFFQRKKTLKSRLYQEAPI